MSDKDLHEQILQPAPRGSKAGWPTVSGQLPLDLHERFEALCRRRRLYETDLIREAVELLLEREGVAA